MVCPVWRAGRSDRTLDDRAHTAIRHMRHARHQTTIYRSGTIGRFGGYGEKSKQLAVVDPGDPSGPHNEIDQAVVLAEAPE